VCNDAVNKAVTRIQGLVPNPTRGMGSVVDSKLRIQMTASASNEVAFSAGGGSLFTQALVSALNTLPTNTSFRQVQAVATKFIRDRATQLGRIPSTPQLFVVGDQRFLDASIFNFGKLISNPNPIPVTPPGQTANVTQLFDTVLSGSNFKVELKSAKTNYAFNDKVTYQIASSQEGYLHLFEIDDQGNVGLLFPNQYSPDNEIHATVGNPLNFPDNDQYSIVALPPASKSRVVALVTTGRPFNLFKNGPGNVQDGFRLILGADAIRQLSALLYKDKILGIVGNASSASHGATQVIVTTGL